MPDADRKERLLKSGDRKERPRSGRDDERRRASPRARSPRARSPRARSPRARSPRGRSPRGREREKPAKSAKTEKSEKSEKSESFDKNFKVSDEAKQRGVGLEQRFKKTKVRPGACCCDCLLPSFQIVDRAAISK